MVIVFPSAFYRTRSSTPRVSPPNVRNIRSSQSTLISDDKRQSRRICYRENEHEFDSYSPVDFGYDRKSDVSTGLKCRVGRELRSQRGSYRGSGSRTFAVRPNFTPSSRGLILGLYATVTMWFSPRSFRDWRRPGERRASRSSPLHTRIVSWEFPGESRARRPSDRTKPRIRSEKQYCAKKARARIGPNAVRFARRIHTDVYRLNTQTVCAHCPFDEDPQQRSRRTASRPFGRLTFSMSEPAHERFPETTHARLTRFPDESPRRFVCVSSGMRNNTKTTRAKRPANEYRFYYDLRSRRARRYSCINPAKRFSSQRLVHNTVRARRAPVPCTENVRNDSESTVFDEKRRFFEKTPRSWLNLRENYSLLSTTRSVARSETMRKRWQTSREIERNGDFGKPRDENSTNSI